MNINITLLGQSIAFGFFIWFCAKFVWPPIINALQDRQKRIADGLAAAQEGQEAQAKAEEEARALVAQAKSQASEIIAKAEKRGQNVVDEAKTAAVDEKDRILASADAELTNNVNSARDALSSQVSEIAVQAASKIIGKEVDSDVHANMIDELVTSIRSKS